MGSLTKSDGTTRVIFATVALGMGVDLKNVQTVVHYGAPRSLDDFFQESGRAGRSGVKAHSVVYWKPQDCPLREHCYTTHDQEIACV